MELDADGRLRLSKRSSVQSPLHAQCAPVEESSLRVFIFNLSLEQCVKLYPLCWESQHEALFLQWSRNRKLRIPSSLLTNTATLQHFAPFVHVSENKEDIQGVLGRTAFFMLEHQDWFLLNFAQMFQCYEQDFYQDLTNTHRKNRVNWNEDYLRKFIFQSYKQHGVNFKLKTTLMQLYDVFLVQSQA